jgi:hypothetical protein
MSKVTLNKAQIKAIQIDLQHYHLGNLESAARGLSALYRSALKKSQQEEILKLALSYGLVSNPGWYA